MVSSFPSPSSRAICTASYASSDGVSVGRRKGEKDKHTALYKLSPFSLPVPYSPHDRSTSECKFSTLGVYTRGTMRSFAISRYGSPRWDLAAGADPPLLPFGEGASTENLCREKKNETIRWRSSRTSGKKVEVGQ